MTVRAKFTVNRIESSMGSRPTGEKDERGYPKHEPCEMKTIVMNPVYGNGNPDHENTKFWQASPSGELKLGTVNAAAAAQFVLGREYYIDFTPANEPPQS